MEWTDMWTNWTCNTCNREERGRCALLLRKGVKEEIAVLVVHAALPRRR